MTALSSRNSELSYARWLPPALAVSLCMTLFPLVWTTVSKHPYRVELFTTIVLAVILVFGLLYDRRSIDGLFVFDDRRAKLIVASMAAFAVWGLISAIWARSPASAWNHTVVWAEYILYFAVFWRRSLSSKSITLITATFILVCVLVSSLCFADYVAAPDFQALEPIIRVRYGKFGEMLATVAPVIWIAALYSRRKARFLLVLSVAAAAWITVMLALSKGAFLAGLAGFAVMFTGCLLHGRHALRRRLLFTLGVWVVATIAFQAGISFVSNVPSTTDLISGKADPTRSSSFDRIFIWNVGKEMAIRNGLIGVGADNFGERFNDYREAYRVEHPDDPPNELVSDGLVERAHNELLQTAAELGVVGLIMLLAPFGIFAVWLFQTLAARGFRLSYMFWGSLGGLVAFAASSMVSSFSLRLTQNGIVFFLVFLIAINELRKARPAQIVAALTNGRSALTVKHVAVGIFLSLMLATGVLKAAAEYYVVLGDRSGDTKSALDLYARARRLDPDYSTTYLHGASRSAAEGDNRTAAQQMRKAIESGCGVVLNYSVLAGFETDTGDLEAASATLEKALHIYPNSVFLRVRYALLLAGSGKNMDSDAQMEAARRIEPRQAAGWYQLIKKGSVAAFYAAQNDRGIAAPAELLPEKAVLMYLDKSPDVSMP